MQASQHIRQLSLKLKQFLKQCVEKNQFSADLSKSTVLNALSPLSGICADQGNAKKDFSVIYAKETEDPYIYALITEYLCRNNSIDTAKTLLQEIDEMFPLQEETEKVPVLKTYCPWSDELKKKMYYEITRKSSKFQQIYHLKAQCKNLIESYKENPFPSDPVSIVYRAITDALSRIDNFANDSNKKERILQDAIVYLRKQLIQENSSLMYFKDRTGYLYSKASKTYKEIQMVLGLLVFSAREREVERLIGIKKIDWPTKKIPLETLYYVGKAMEKINMFPYNSDVEIESAVPPALSFHSTFFCPILRCECSVDNPPCILTCGHAISVRALEKITSFKGLIFKCPYCPKDANIKDVFKANLFI